MVEELAFFFKLIYKHDQKISGLRGSDQKRKSKEVVGAERIIAFN